MAAASTLTWDLATPRRPTLEDCGDAQLQDHATRPPKAPTQPYADQLNQWAMQIARLGGVVPVAVISIQISGGVPSVYSFTACPTAVLTGTFTVTDNGTGDTSITWPASTFPVAAARPAVSINSDLLAIPRAFNITNGVRVKTANAAGTLIDAEFTVLVY